MREPADPVPFSPAVHVCLWMPFFEVMREEEEGGNIQYTYGNIAAVKLDISEMLQLLRRIRIRVGSEFGWMVWSSGCGVHSEFPRCV